MTRKLTLYAVAINDARGKMHIMAGTNGASRMEVTRRFCLDDEKPWRYWRRQGYRTVKLECEVSEWAN